MKTLLKYILPVLVIAFAGIGYRFLEEREMPPETKKEVANVLEVPVSQVQFEDVYPEISAYGSVRPDKSITLVSEVSGRVVSSSDVFFKGGVFRRGEVMLELDTSDYKAAVAEAEAALARVLRELASERERGRQARIDWNDLGQGSPTDLALRKPQLAEAKAQVKAAMAALERAERNLAKTRIRAPFTCLVTGKNVGLGGYVTAGGAVGVVAGLESAEIRLLVPLSEAALMDLPRTSPANISTQGPGGTASGHVQKRSARTFGDETGQVRIYRNDMPGDFSWQGRVIRTEGVVDPETRLTCLVVMVEDPYGLSVGSRERPQLLFGSFVTAKLHGSMVRDAVVLPPHLVGEDGGVWTVSDKDTLEMKSVEVLRREQSRVIIKGGLVSGERVSGIRFPDSMDGRSVVAVNDMDSPAEGILAGTSRGDNGGRDE